MKMAGRRKQVEERTWQLRASCDVDMNKTLAPEALLPLPCQITISKDNLVRHLKGKNDNITLHKERVYLDTLPSLIRDIV